MPEPIGLGQKIANWIDNNFEKWGIWDWVKRVRKYWELHDKYGDKMLSADALAATIARTRYIPKDYKERFDALKTGNPDVDAYIEAHKKAIEEADKALKALPDFLEDKWSEHNIEGVVSYLINQVYAEIIKSLLINPDDIPPELRKKILAFLTKVTELTVGPALIGSLIEAATGGVVKNAGRYLSELYWILGLGFVTWQVTSPLVEAGIRMPLEKWIKEYFRPRDISPSDVVEAFVEKRRTRKEAEELLRKMGYPDEQAKLLLDLAERPLPASEILSAWSAGKLFETTARWHLQRLGYSDESINIMLENHRPIAKEEPKKELKTTIMNAFQKGLISESDVYTHLRKLNYSDYEIELSIKLARIKQQVEYTTMRVEQIHKAYVNNVITAQDARQLLEKLGYDAYGISILLATWDTEKRPRELIVSDNTLKLMFFYDVIDSQRLRSLLLEKGYKHDVVDNLLTLYIKLKEEFKQKKKETEPTVPSERTRQLTVALLFRALEINALTTTEVQDKLIAMGYKPEDVQTLFAVYTYQPPSIPEPEPEKVKLPSRTDFINWWVMGLITTEECKLWLSQLGYDENFIELMLSYELTTRKQSDIIRAYLAGNLNYADALRELLLRGVHYEQAINLMEKAEENKRYAHILVAYAAKAITREQAMEELRKLGMSPEAIEKVLKELAD
jgi:hypothetical protein